MKSKKIVVVIAVALALTILDIQGFYAISIVSTRAIGKIAFVSHRDGKNEIYVMDEDGTNQRRLTFSEEGKESRDPAWSPDGKQIAFTYRSTSDANYASQIYVMDANGNNPHPVNKNLSNAYEPARSPDGQHIAFIAISLPNFNPTPHEMSPEGKNVVQLYESGQDNGGLNYSPDGRKLLFHSYGGHPSLYMIEFRADHKVKTIKSLADPLPGAAPEGGFISHDDLYPTFSPDGSIIAFVAHRDDFACGINMYGMCIFLMSQNGTNIHYLPINQSISLDPNYYDLHLSWSPDGKYLAFSGYVSSVIPISIWRTDLKGNIKQLTDDSSTNFDPAWQPIKH
jgi:Tol biopolymer transport system component